VPITVSQTNFSNALSAKRNQAIATMAEASRAAGRLRQATTPEASLMAKDIKFAAETRRKSPAGKWRSRQSSRRHATSDAALGRNRGAGAAGNDRPGVGAHPAGTITTEFTFYANPTLTLVCMPPEAPALFSLDFAAELTGVHPEMLRYYCRLGLLGKDRARMDCEPTFDEDALQEVRRIEHYRRRLAISRRALPLICALRREAERLEIEIQFLRGP
jgi:hypothetical protein